MKHIYKELLYFSAILVILAIMQHPDLLTAPLERLSQMNNNGNYLHPFFWSLIVYLSIGIFRLIIKFIKYLINR